jgi:Tol biopolymer transport system component
MKAITFFHWLLPWVKKAFLFCLFVAIGLKAHSQYFGRNKPSYKIFDYKVYQTPNFEIYHYLDNDSVLNVLANRSESWYKHHQAIFRDTIENRNPIIFYENHADFQQTTAVSGMLSEGTGGVTEAFKQRVVMPLTPSFAQTDHVLGHELVHAFQFNMLLNNDSLKLENIRNLPLWMIEGMAEYFSIGSIDPHTSMWMRDAVLANDIPSLKDMTRSNKYFPYRYGQAVIAMIGKTWGDSVIVPLFKETAMLGYDKAFKNVLGMDEKKFSELWKASLIANYSPLLTDTLDNIRGRKILFDKNAGEMNLSPSVSPDGKHLVFLSEKDVFTLDLFLADAHTGKILKKLSSRINKNEIDALSYLESAGTWSPDGKYFAFVVFSEGKNKLVILSVDRRRNIRETELPGLPAFNNPSWSPDGKYIVVSAMKNGVSDLFLYEVNSKNLRQLTNDSYAKLQPSWSPDGNFLTYVTDKPMPGQALKFRHDFYNIAIIDINDPSSEIVLELFTGARNMNPVFSSDGRNIYFLSDRDGFRNLYRYSLTESQIWQQTKYMRGITGITSHSPAISIARETGDIVYSYYSKGNYTIYSVSADEFSEFQIEKNSIDFTAATLPPMMHISQNLVDNSLQSEYKITDTPAYEYYPVPYQPKFKLDYVSNTSVGVAAGRMGTGMAGSVSAIFGDMVGDNQIYASLAMNGEIYDFGGQIAYINQKKKLKWGAALSHIPYYYGSVSFGLDTLSIGGEQYTG